MPNMPCKKQASGYTLKSNFLFFVKRKITQMGIDSSHTRNNWLIFDGEIFLL